MKNTSNEKSFQLLVSETFDSLRDMVHFRMRGAMLGLVENLFFQEVNRLCGVANSRKNNSLYHRGGSDPGSIYLNGQKVSVRKPRVKNNGKEVELETYSALKNYDMLCEKIMNYMLHGVSTRNYDPLLDEIQNGLGLKKNTVSRAFIKGSRLALDEINGRDLSNENFFAIMIDGIKIADRCVIVAMGITLKGEKKIIGLREGNTENSEVCKDLLESFKERGMDPKDAILFVIDGSKALRKGIAASFGKHHPVQRCMVHKLRNLYDYVPKKYHSELKRKWRLIHNCSKYEDAIEEYEKLISWLTNINHQSKASLEEAQMETLTVIKLLIPGLLRRTLYSTNPLESIFSQTGDSFKRVKNWNKSKDQISRWTAATLLEVEKRLKKIRGYRQIPLVINKLKNKSLFLTGKAA